MADESVQRTGYEVDGLEYRSTVSFPKAKYSAGGNNFKISIEFLNPKDWAEWADCERIFNNYLKRLFKDVVFESHKYLIRVTPIDTGRLRGGWTSFLDKYNVDYTRALMDTSLIETKSTVMRMDCVDEGKGMGSFTEAPLDVTVVNNVPYGEHQEWGTPSFHGRYFTLRAMYKSELIFSKAVEAWIRDSSAANKIVKPRKVVEVVA